ncbi:MAG: hypothetical protein U0289_18180 [Cyclobacteriaceae bacterium]
MYESAVSMEKGMPSVKANAAGAIVNEANTGRNYPRLELPGKDHT